MGKMDIVSQADGKKRSERLRKGRKPVHLRSAANDCRNADQEDDHSDDDYKTVER